MRLEHVVQGQLSFYDDGGVDIFDVVALVDCILVDCWEPEAQLCPDPIAINHNPEATYDDGSCQYTDIDGNIYSSVIIGDQKWLGENLVVTNYQNGEPIPTGFSNTEWSELSTGAYSYMADDPVYAEIFGNLYNWFAVDDSRGICPEGWHVPTDGEWQQMIDYLGGDDLAGGKLKEAGFAHWLEPNEGATNESGFTALPGGGRGSHGGYGSFGNFGLFWTSTHNYGYGAWYQSLTSFGSGISRSHLALEAGHSVRCIQD